MRRTKRALSLIAPVLGAVLLAACATGSIGGKSMGFFVTSANSGKGADFGGLAGADKYCQDLAAAAGAGGRTWRAYLSTSAMGGSAAVNARDRIGAGPWYNAKGELIATNVDELHGVNKLTKQTALTEKGGIVNGRGDTPNMHDILTGSSPEGRAMAGDKDTTCGNWTKSGDGSAIVGHSDRTGLDESAPAKSWNSSHPSQGCSLDALKKTGGDGRMYCFASN
ncbi:hypothetical protein QTI66_12200 [Variovorax sp. J22R133]|uniref:hypothetical protein n=1 Tax=Variovorax brevis TaxID=3053503 RepID=UPI002578B243|nr:hypothetical protein [Variovorax sp. J22R133]MDM0112913.1 hypothetical protein [Variovorax sp. J22R133]